MLTVTLVENRRLDRATRYTMYLTDGYASCAELGCGPRAEDAYVEAQMALTNVLAQLRDRTVEAETISPNLVDAFQEPITHRALSVQEYAQKFGPDAQRAHLVGAK